LERAVHYVFATADYGVGTGQRAQFAPRSKSLIQSTGEAAESLSLWHERRRRRMLSNSSPPGDLTLNQSLVQTSYSGEFADAEDSVDRGFLKAVHCHKSRLNAAPK
jgi:hypothetical protein